MRVLVTGGAGFIGAHLAARLVELGHEVVILDDFNSGVYPAWLKEERVKRVILATEQVAIMRGNILDEDFLNTVFERHRPTHVFHGAAYACASVPPAEEALYNEVNVAGTLRVLQCAERCRVQRVVLASSAAVYSDQQASFQETQYPLRPLTVYGASKAALEVYGRMWHERYGLPVVMLRFFSTYGPWGRPDMAPMIFAHRLLTRQPIALNKEERWRDFTYVSDVVDGIVAALTSPLAFGVFNVGRGRPENLRNFIAALEKAASVAAIIEERSTPEGEMRVTYANISAAQQQLGYSPKVSLEQGIKPFMEWMRDWYVPRAEAKISASLSDQVR